MKEIYEWRKWFGELAQKIKEGGRENLHKKVFEEIDWGEGGTAIKDFEVTDPFSFFYFLAFKIGSKDKEKICKSISKEFGIDYNLLPDLNENEYFIFPRPIPIAKLLFINGEASIKQKEEDAEICWQLFEQVVGEQPAKDLNEDLFQKVLNIKNVGVSKLTQTLFLIDPEKFIPVDKTGPLAIAKPCGLPSFEDIEKAIIGKLEINNKTGLAAYLEIQEQIKSKFPECEFYEINHLAHLLGQKRIKITNQYWQVSTNVEGDGIDYWDELKENYYVKARPYGKVKYPTGDAQIGDIILVRAGSTRGRAIGIVFQTARKSGDWDIIDVLWITKQEAVKPFGNIGLTLGFSRAGVLTDRFEEVYPTKMELIKKIRNWQNKEIKISEEPKPNKIMNNLNQIFYGPPGTGKTYHTIAEAVKIAAPLEYKEDNLGEQENREALKKKFDELKKEGAIEFITFHQSYSYEDFVEGIKPNLDGSSQISYQVQNGIFKKICKHALDNEKKQNYVLIIDEINRGNISKIFGELITLIENDKRIGNQEELRVQLPYSQDDFGVPNNLYIIGTMNTADRSLSLLDTALRRRFRFVEMMPDDSLLDFEVEGINIQTMLKKINHRIAKKYGREHQIGHSFFMKLENNPTIKYLSEIFQHEVLPLLEEYFYEDREEINEVLGKNGFYDKDENSNQWELKIDELGKPENYTKIYSKKE